MIVSKEVTLGDILFIGSILPIAGLYWAGKRIAAYLKRKPTKRKAPKKSRSKRVPRIVTARDHRKVYGAAPAMRIINGGKS